MQSSPALNKILTEYLPKELIPTDWSWRTNKTEENNLQVLLNTGKLGMYSSEDQLFDDIQKFQAFPRSHVKFGFEITDQFWNEPALYTSIQGVNYVYKSDLYSILFQDFAAINLDGTPACVEFITDLFAFYLHKKESKYPLNAEMTTIPEEEIKELVSTMRKIADELDGLEKEPVECTSNMLNQYWIELFQLDDEKSKEQFQIWTEKAFERIPLKKCQDFYHHAMTWSKFFVQKFDSFISKHSEHFLPSSMAPAEKAVIRIFCCKKVGDFMMAHEVLQALKQTNMDVSSIENEILAMPKLSTWTLRDFNKKVSMEVKKNVIFILHRSTLTEFRPTPIPTIDGGYCVPASTALMTHLTDMIVAKKVFRIMRTDQLPLMDKYIESLLKYFDARRRIYFMDLEEIEAMENEWNLFFNANFKDQSKDIREIRNVRKTGFSTNDVFKELQYLKVDRCFPVSLKNAVGSNDIVHYGLCDMYKSVKDSQKRLFFIQYPKMFEFLHSQGGCGPLRPLECPSCLGPKTGVGQTKNSESEKAERLAAKNSNEAAEGSFPETESGAESHAQNENSTDKVAPGTGERKQKKKKTKKARKEDMKASEVEPEAQSQLNQEQELVATATLNSDELKPEKKKKKTSKSSEEVSEPSKESQACPKCIRTSEFHRNTNEKLRLSKVEVKALKKELTEIQKVNEEKEVRIRLLERKLFKQETRLKEQELQLKEKDAEIKKLKIVSLEKTKEIEKQEERIDSLKDKIYEQEGLISRMKNHYLKSTPTRSPEESRKFNVHLLKLLDIQKTLKSENPIKKVEEVTSTLAKNSKNQEIRYLAKSVMKIYQIQLGSYTKVLEGNIKLVQANQNITMDQIPDLLDFPQFSQEFRDAFKKTVTKVAPVICRSLLKNPPEEPECSICLEKIDYKDETSQCGTCNWIYHKGCIKEWLKEKKTCPSCRSLNDEEFPKLC